MTMNEEQEWKPQPEGLQQILQLLKESQSSDNAIQKNVQKVISQPFNLFFCFYLILLQYIPLDKIQNFGLVMYLFIRGHN